MSFHSLVTLPCLATWRLGPELSPEALSHKLTTRRCEFLLKKKLFKFYLLVNSNIFFFSEMATMKENKEKGVVDEVTKPEAQFQPRPFAGDKRKNFIQDA